MQINCGSYLKWCINIILKHHLKLLVYKHIPQDKPEQADQIFLLSIILEILLTWEYKQPYHIAKKKNSTFNGKYDVFIKPFCFVTSTFLHISVTEHKFSALITAALQKRHSLCHCPLTSVLLLRGGTAQCSRTRRYPAATRNTRNTE